MNTNNTNLKYFLYARKSTESDDKQAASIEDQITEMKRLAQRLGLNILDTITESRSAKKPGRLAFNEMIERIRNGEANAILCWKLNRLARNPVDGGQISWMLQQGVVKHIQTYSGDFKPSDNVLLMQVEFGMANQYIKDLIADTRRGMRLKAERGWSPAGTLPAGYIHSREHPEGQDQITVIPDLKTFALIKDLWKKMLTGKFSISDIKREGDRLGLRNRNGHLYSMTGYRVIFTNEFYCGWLYWRNEDGISERMKGKHMRMISEEEFNRVQLFLGERGKPTRINKYQFPFRGSMRCGECGRSITAERKIQVRCTKCRFKFSMRHTVQCPKCQTEVRHMGDPHIIDRTYYTCVGATKKKCSQRAAVEEKDLETQISKVIDTIRIPKEFHDWAVDAIRFISGQETNEQGQKSSDLKKRENDLMQRLDRFVLLRANEEISAEQLAKLTNATERDLAGIRSEIRSLHGRAIDWAHIANQYLTFAEKAHERFSNGDPETKKAILGGMSPNLILKDKILHISLPKPLLGIQKSYHAFMQELAGLEPEKIGSTKTQSAAFGDGLRSDLALLNDFRTFDWAEEYKYPTVVLDQMKGLLAKYENL